MEGASYGGSYRVDKGIVYVSSAYGSKSTQQGGMPADALARLLLHELVDHHERARPDR